MSKESEIEASIRALEAQRSVLGDTIVDTAISALRERQAKPANPLATVGERKLVTIVFADISGFTRMSETRDPEEVRELITQAFDVLVPVIERYGGIVDKFIGDAVMALFGAKVAREDDARRALLAALDMRDAFDAFVARTGLDLGIHFGINSGTVVTGSVGATSGGAFSVMGDAVNLAARLEDLSETGEILIGPTTRDLGGEGFAFEARPVAKLKGKKDPVPVFALLGRQEAPASQRLRAPLIGREREAAVIAAALARAQQGQAASICIIGEAGTGKSRLVAEARTRSPNETQWVQVRSVSHDQAIGFGALRTAVHTIAGLSVGVGASAEATAQAIRNRLEPRFQEDEWADVFAQLGMLAGLEETSAETAVGGVASDLLEQRLAETLRRWFEPLASEAPLAIVWEDLHWADRSSLLVLERMFPDHLPKRCLQILCFRPVEELRAAIAGSGAELIKLEPLSADDSAALVSALVKTARLGADVIATILARAEGNPFFLEEIIQSLMDAGDLALVEGQILVKSTLEARSIPTTLQGVLMARIDQLNPSEKQVLQTASVIGRIFEPPLLGALLVEDARLLSALEELLKSLYGLDLVRPIEATAASDGSYKFKHALTQEVAYHSVLLATRRKLHRAAAAVLATATEARTEDASTLVAYHFENSDQPALAIPYLKSAAQASARAHAPREAVALYRRIVALAPILAAQSDGGAAVLAQAYEAMGDLLRLNGRLQQALECFDRALELVPTDHGLHRAGLVRRSGLAWMTQRDAGHAFELYLQAEALLEGAGERTDEWWGEWLDLHLDRVWAQTWLGQNREAFELMRTSAADFETHGTIGQRAQFYDQMLRAQLLREAAHPSDDTIAKARQALEMAREWGELRAIGMSHFALGHALTFRRELSEARSVLQEAVRIAVHIGDVEYEVASRAGLGIVARMGGDVNAVEESMPQVVATARAGSMNAYVAVGLANQAWAAQRRGQLPEARAAATEAAKIWTKEPWRILWLAHWPLLAIALNEGDSAAAKFHAKAMLAPIQYDMGSEITTFLREGCEWENAGDENRALVEFARARHPAEVMGFV